MNLPLFILQFADAVSFRKRMLLRSALVSALIASVIGGFSVFSQASVFLIQVEINRDSPMTLTLPQLREALQSPDFLRAVQRDSRLSQRTLSQLHPEIVQLPEKKECFELRVRSRKGDSETLYYAQTFATNLIQFLHQEQLKEAKAKSVLLDQRLTQMESDLAQVEQQLLRRDMGAGGVKGEISQVLQHRAQLDQRHEELLGKIKTLDLKMKDSVNQFLRQSPALLSAREELAKALLRYTEEHPLVKELRAAVAAAESRLKSIDAGSFSDLDLAQAQLPTGLGDQLRLLQDERSVVKAELDEIKQAQNQFDAQLNLLPQKRLEYSRLKSRQESLEKSLQELAPQRDRLALHLSNSFNPLEILRTSHSHRTAEPSRWVASVQYGAGGGFFALLLGGLAAWIVELLSGRIRSSGVLAKVTGLPVIATVGDITGMSDLDRDRWAFETLAFLKGRFASSTRSPLVCGFISSGPGEGRSTWIALLAQAAKKQGHPVLTINSNGLPGDPGNQSEATCISPLLITETTALSRCQNQPIMNIPIPGRIWDLELRRQWQDALQRWKEIQELIVLVELPPASTSEGILLSEDFPNLIWLADSERATAKKTRSHVAVLNHSRARFVGAVLNRARQMKSFCSCAALALFLFAFWGTAAAQEIAPQLASPPALATNLAQPLAEESPTGISVDDAQGFQGSFSVTSPEQLADWQKRLTLGPGDILNISLYGKADSTRNGLFIGPDGRLTFLQAQDIPAAGLTVEELRAALETALSKYFLAPRVIVQPVAFNSKKYYILGNVVQKGVFPLNRPITVLEAIAQAQGFASTLQNRNTLLLADLSRSFLVRKRSDGRFERMPVDFERLFLRGDLTQNTSLAPDDYLYFPPLDLQEIYIIGAVQAPGPLPYTPDATIIGAIASKGGFIEKAYRQRVLVVRGSLKQPQTFVVDTSAILAARVSDFELKPRDIVYISRRPWAKAEELLELATTEFLRAAVITWTGQNVGPIIND